MTTAQLEFTAEELLAGHPIAEPLVVNGVRCHGGFTDSGDYVSPRTRNRRPAIDAWEAQRVEQFGTPLLDIPLETWPENFPNVEQTKFMLRHGVTAPTISALTRIGTVEGFGARLRLLPVLDAQRLFAEDVTGTAIDHMGRGLVEAHARDEAGFGDEAGHNVMWFAARDVAFENPVTEDETERMLARFGIPNQAPSPADLARAAEAARAARVLPDDVDFTLEMVVGRLIGLLLIEISAFHGFRWAEAVLADTELVAGDGEAARLVSFIRADETPHVDWLRTALSEMRDRTWIGASGATYPGTEMIGRVWDRAVRDSTMLRRSENLQFALGETRRALEGRPDAEDLLHEMLSLGSVVLRPDGTLADAEGEHLLG